MPSALIPPKKTCVGAAFAVGDCLCRQLEEALEPRSAQLIEPAEPLIEVDVSPAIGPAWGPVANLVRTGMS
jgi:hypothetical protein